MLVTQNQSSLNWNSSFSKQEQGNSNEVFNLEFPSKIEVSSDIKTAKKLEINGIEYLEFPSSNVVVNSAVSSAVSSATAVSQTTATTATAYGYSVDSKGFMGPDFNAATGLPQDFKIHKSTLDEFNRVLQRQNQILSIDTNGDFLSNIDIADTMGQYFQVFSQIVPQKDSFSTNELSTLPKGYMSDGVKIDYYSLLGSKKNEKVVNIFKDSDALNNAKNLSSALYAVSFNITELDFSTRNLQKSSSVDESEFNPDMEHYKNDDGTYSYEAVFIGFLKSSELMPLRGGQTSLSHNAMAYRDFAYQKENNSRSLSVLDILNGKTDLKELLKSQIQSNIWLRDSGKADNQMIQNLKSQGLWWDENTDISKVASELESELKKLASTFI